MINQILTQEEIENGLSIVVERNNVDPNTPRRLQSFQDKEKNSQVVFMQEPLKIALVFDDVTFAKLEAGFEELGVGVSPSKTFGFLKNSTVQIKDSAGNAINPISITPEIVKETFIVNGNIDAVTETIQKNFAIQNVYLRANIQKTKEETIAITQRLTLAWKEYGRSGDNQRTGMADEKIKQIL